MFGLILLENVSKQVFKVLGLIIDTPVDLYKLFLPIWRIANVIHLW